MLKHLKGSSYFLRKLRECRKNTVLELLESLKSDPGNKYIIASRIAELGASAVEPLIGALSDADENVSACATLALSRIGKPATKQLVKALRYSGLRERAGMALIGMGNHGIRALISALASERDEVDREFCISTLVEAGEAAVPELMHVVREKGIRRLSDRLATQCSKTWMLLWPHRRCCILEWWKNFNIVVFKPSWKRKRGLYYVGHVIEGIGTPAIKELAKLERKEGIYLAIAIMDVEIIGRVLKENIDSTFVPYVD